MGWNPVFCASVTTYVHVYKCAALQTFYAAFLLAEGVAANCQTLQAKSQSVLSVSRG